MKLEYTSVMLGWVSMIPIALLFLPVTRGSPILKLIDIPFEHAVKYHVWLGHLTLILVFGHGVAYLIYYSLMNEAHLVNNPHACTLTSVKRFLNIEVKSVKIALYSSVCVHGFSGANWKWPTLQVKA